MERIRMIGLGKSFGVRQVFSNVSFELKEGDRLALVGPNGAGKSTLLKCILGYEELDEGNVVKSPVASIGYLQQDVNLGDDSLATEIEKAWADVHALEKQLKELTSRLESEEASESDLQRLDYLQNRLEWLGGYDYEQKTKRIVYGLGFTDEDLDKPANAFSGGQKTRINLAKALVRRPDFLFLDEPTNHLDMDMLEWLEGYLSAYPGGILIVSHDRYFLDRIVTGVVELDNHKATTYRGNYSRYIQQRDERLKADMVAYEKQQEYIKKTEAYIDKYRAGIKSKMARGRQSQLNRLERLEAPVTSHHLQFSFPPAAMSADKVLVLDHLSVGYGESRIIDDISLVVRRGESVAFIGPNGAGKSTLVKTIVGELFPESGHVDIGNRVQVGYFSQEHEELHDSWQVVDEIMNHFNYSEDKARNVLGSFLFKGDDVFKLVGELSGGERARLALLKLFLQGDNFLILDEPTNHLDIPTREIVERALQQFEGTCFIISHDRYFLDQVSTKTVILDEGKITEYLGNYSYYKEKLKEQEDLLALANEKNSESSKRDSKATPTNESMLSASETIEENQKKPNAYMVEKQLAEVEAEIARLEATMKMYEVQLANPVVQQAITGGKATISGSQSLEEAKDLAILLRSGALPVKINVLEVRTVGPSLGQDSKDKSVVAFSAGIAMIMIFLVILYRFSGIVANIALLVYVMLLLLVLGKGFNATMTLPGIAGIILSMGVAVDANILIFERFKEEVFSGKSMRVSMEAGFSRALATITDANVSVIITAGILTVLGSGPVKGFAISLGVGVVVSMFTAIIVSRFLLRMLIECNFTNHPFWFGANISPSTSADAFAPKSLKGGKRK